MNDSRIIVSLDFPEMKMAVNFAKKIDPERCRLKIGKQLFTNSGPLIVELLTDAGFEIFLDLKFHDIPNTVASACQSAAKLGVWMINVHAIGGKLMLEAAREAIDRESHQPMLMAVTLLTSISKNDLSRIGIQLSIKEIVYLLTMDSLESGFDGVICSAQESHVLRDRIDKDFCLVTPGIRPSGFDKHDQSRIVTPKDAILAGSNYLVIGRPITQAKEPLKTLESIELEINKAIAEVNNG